MTPSSPLALLHPEGRIENVLVLGERRPSWLPAPGEARAGGKADLALLVPSAAELGRRGWLERAARDAAQGLAKQGLAYALVPRRSRAAARRQLRAAGLALEAPLAQLPGRGYPRYLLPLAAAPWRHALAHAIAARPHARLALRATRALPLGGPLLAAALPALGVVGRRPGADPLAAWVERLGGEARPAAHAVVTTSWRGPGGPIVLHLFAPGEGEPWGVAKVAPESSAESGLLGELGPAARASGARVPRVLAAGQVGGAPVLVETVVAGRPAAELLAGSPQSFAAVAGALADWQERWGRATATAAGIDAGRLERELLRPAAELASAIPDAAAYRGWLAERCVAATVSAIPSVARHNDLTMWNVLVEGSNPLGVLDWAEAEPAGLPLTDFFYAVADAAAACDGYRSRVGAVRSCFVPGGARAGAVAALGERLRSAVGLTPAAAELCFHACWLHHALNEQRAARENERPFLEIVRWQARQALGGPA